MQLISIVIQSSCLWSHRQSTFPVLEFIKFAKLDCITSNNRKTGVNVVALVNRFETSRVNSPFKDLHSHPIHKFFSDDY